MIAEQHRVSTLDRYAKHRQAWDENQALRTLYARWYGSVAAQLPVPPLGPVIELGSGPGFARPFIPGLQLSDVVRAPWHDHEISAHHLPFADGALGALVLFDVLHHLPAPAAFFTEADRALAEGGRVVMCEPYVSPASYPVYRWFHPEPLVWGVDPLQERVDEGTEVDPFDSNQAIPTLLFGRRAGLGQFQARFPRLKVLSVERLSGFSHPASGGFGRPAFLPLRLWKALDGLEQRLPAWAYRLIGFRMLVVLEKRSR